MSFWGELKRRNVYKVGVAYAIVAWLLIQGADIIFPHLNLPSWAVTFLIVFLIIGFPVAILLAWAYEVTPDGIKRTKQGPLAESITHITGQKFNYIVTGLLVLAVGFLVVKEFYFDRRAVKQEVVTTETQQVPTVSDVEEAPKTIAVLPFSDISPEKDQEYFVDGLSEELLNSLCQIPDLRVTARTSSFTFKGSDKTVQEIASILGVANILEGSVRKAGNALRITAQLVRATDGFHLWSKTYDRELKDIFAVQEDIAKAVADELKITLGIGKSIKQIGGTDNAEAYELYLVAKGQFQDIEHALVSIDAAIALDPEFAVAWAHKALIHSVNTIAGPANRVNAEQDAGLRAALKAIELEPNLAVGYASLGRIKTNIGDLIDAELAFRNALELTTEQLVGYGNVVTLFYLSVGHFERAHELLEEMRRNDPLNPVLRAQYMLNFAYLGEMQRAEEEYKRGRALFGDKWWHGDLYILAHRFRTGEVLSRNEIAYSDKIFDVAKEHLDSPEEGLSEMYRIYANDNNLTAFDFISIALWAAYFGDPELALDAMEKYLKLEKVDIFFAWFPVMRKVRKLPRFKELVKEIGLVDYWNKFGWPDICRPLDNGDFECD